MPLSEALCGMLAFLPANQVLIKGIWFNLAFQDRRMEVREAKQPQKVSTSL